MLVQALKFGTEALYYLLFANLNVAKQNVINLAIIKLRDCAEIQSNGSTTSGVYTVFVGSNYRPLTVYCDMKTTSSGWTVRKIFTMELM